MKFLTLEGMDNKTSLSDSQGGFHRIGESFAKIRVAFNDQPVHHHLDRVFFVFRQGLHVLKPPDDAVDPHPAETLPAKGIELITMLAFSVFNDRGQQMNLGALGQIRQSGSPCPGHSHGPPDARRSCRIAHRFGQTGRADNRRFR